VRGLRDGLGAPLACWEAPRQSHPGGWAGGPRGWRLPRADARLSPPQLLKKIKRCERKGSESVTEEKCAVLFSSTVTLTPGNLSVHLQVPAPLPRDGAGRHRAFPRGTPAPRPGQLGAEPCAGLGRSGAANPASRGVASGLRGGRSPPPGPLSAHRGHRPWEPGQ